MNIVVLGATGNVGRKIADEAAERGHRVTAVARDVSEVPNDDRIPVAADASQVDQLAEVLRGHDVVICALRWDNNDVHHILDSVRAADANRLIVVVGAGSLQMPDGRVYYHHLLDRGIDPPSSRAALAAFDDLRQVADLDWTAASPAAQIESGDRTGVFRLGQDSMMMDGAGESRISQQDFAVAIIDEAEQPQFRRQRFTVAY